jgi:endoglycosylceramidase
MRLRTCRKSTWLSAVVLVVAVCGCHGASLRGGEAAGDLRPVGSPWEPIPARGGLLRASGRYFTDPDGRVVILRGVNLAGDSKVPPFLPMDNPAQLDPLPAVGINVIRLVFIWEAFEPEPGHYDESYLAKMRAIAEAAWARGIYVIVDFHQDGFARFLSRGCGAGFPLWAVSPRAKVTEPDNGCRCKNWVFLEVTDPNVHKSLEDFYADTHGVRTRFLAMVDRVASAFAATTGVIGYDLLNEPWGDETREIAPLYHDEAATIRTRHPGAILFVAGHATTGNGRQTWLPRPAFENFAYSPHYYNPFVILFETWHGGTYAIDQSFQNMESKASEWDVPLFLAEYGVGADVRRGRDYVAYLNDHLDIGLSSGAQWNYTPHWNDRVKDGWNDEDYNILHPSGALRPNYRVRAYPRRIAGLPVAFQFRESSSPRGGPCLTFTWEHRPERGETEVFVPDALFHAATLSIEPADAAFRWDAARQLLIVGAPRAVTVRIALSSP